MTGGSRGTGAAIARRFAREVRPWRSVRPHSPDKTRTVARQIEADDGRALVIRSDRDDPVAAGAPIAATVRTLGGLDILVNNAGIFIGGPTDRITVKELDDIFAVDVRAVFLSSQAAARYMADGGRVITIGSVMTERVPVADLTVCAMCKSALTGLTKGLVFAA
ncbi:SDR family NAD(P)-dependent oxidoreductase [Streptomyces pseudovenezuelae]|uniref:SDR family NAD(P)-dependent oxidoreductase n=1 Tax=Streptomyces pseudovenezuelae TaxID=67350 RepID=UPI0037122544